MDVHLMHNIYDWRYEGYLRSIFLKDMKLEEKLYYFKIIKSDLININKSKYLKLRFTYFFVIRHTCH